MEDGLLSLKWNNHRSTFFHILSTLREKGTYTDATLACEGEFFSVHKLVMSTCSDYFADMFERTQCKSPVVVLKDINKSDLGALLDYMYLGEVDVRQNDLAGLIKAAECLRIKGLAVPDEDPGKVHKPQKTNNSNSASRVPDHHRRTNSSSPPPNSNKRQRRDSGSGSISHNLPSNNSPNVNNSGNSRTSSVPSQSPVVPPVIKGGGGEPPSPARDDSPDILPIEQIKVERDEGGGASNNSSAQLDHRGTGNSDLEDDSGGMGGAADDMTDFSQFTQDDIEKQEHDQMEYPDQLAGPSGLQGGGSVLNWGEGEDGGFPQNLFGNDDPNQQQVMMEFISTTEGRMVLLDGYAYILDTHLDNTLNWACEFKSCGGRLKTEYNVIKEKSSHTHPSDFERNLYLKSIQNTEEFLDITFNPSINCSAQDGLYVNEHITMDDGSSSPLQNTAKVYSAQNHVMGYSAHGRLHATLGRIKPNSSPQRERSRLYDINKGCLGQETSTGNLQKNAKVYPIKEVPFGNLQENTKGNPAQEGPSAIMQKNNRSCSDNSLDVLPRKENVDVVPRRKRIPKNAWNILTLKLCESIREDPSPP